MKSSNVRKISIIKKWESLQRELVPRARRLGLRDEDDVNRLIHRLRR